MTSEVRTSSICIESTTICQLRCPGCKTATGEVHDISGRGFLRFEPFRALIDSAPELQWVELSNNGEMFLNPELLPIMEYAHRKGVRLTAANGVNLNFVRPEVLEGLVKYGFYGMTVSIDGASEETYGQYRKRGSYRKVMDNLQALNDLKKEHESSLPNLVWQFVVFGHNEHEIVEAAFEARKLGMQIRFKLQWDDDFAPVTDVGTVTKILGAATRAEYEERYGVSYMRATCHQLWNSPVFNWDGELLGCCKNWWGDFSANLFEDGLANSVNSESIAYARSMLRGAAPARDDIPCVRCPEYQRMAASLDLANGAGAHSSLSPCRPIWLAVSYPCTTARRTSNRRWTVSSPSPTVPSRSSWWTTAPTTTRRGSSRAITIRLRSFGMSTQAPPRPAIAGSATPGVSSWRCSTRTTSGIRIS